ncbi:MAG: hypothetical protein Q7J54_04260 [Candidatus Woesearchaeota archaeon]|nr:hypothetical protein [Candidatus Woesearchaeota archaeon]
MVVEEAKAGKPYYVCEECSFAYEGKKWAEKCQKWCKEHHSCNTGIAKHAVMKS